MLEVSEARSRILEAMKPTGSELVSLPEAAGRVLSQSVRANVTNPPTDVSSMDGYAVRAEDACAGRLLAVIGEAPAGHPSDLSVDPGTSIRIFTGSVMPAGAEAVVIQENTERRGANIFLTENVQAGAFIRRAGQDFAAGDILVAAGKRLGSRDIGLAAAGNTPWVSVYRRPRVAILSTGDELVMPGETLLPGGILGSAGLMLQALLRSAGADVVLLPVARDDEAEIRRLVSGLDAIDLLVTIGGASVGDYDLVQSALKAAGLRTEFWKIAMRPGKPL
ncbi:MAG: molybdopterin molybdotransferase MoeA, partial [Acetobacter sp.]|nr:molybdopterin molybdotransferase MoeA [Acetobacter sp.]